jgi:hypothetical protein
MVCALAGSGHGLLDKSDDLPRDVGPLVRVVGK